MIDTLINQRVIVVSNNTLPYIGFVRGYCPVTGQPIVVDSINNWASELISFGVVLPFTEATWLLLNRMSIAEAWEWAGNISIAIQLRERKQ